MSTETPEQLDEARRIYTEVDPDANMADDELIAVVLRRERERHQADLRSQVEHWKKACAWMGDESADRYDCGLVGDSAACGQCLACQVERLTERLQTVDEDRGLAIKRLAAERAAREKADQRASRLADEADKLRSEFAGIGNAIVAALNVGAAFYSDLPGIVRNVVRERDETRESLAKAEADLTATREALAYAERMEGKLRCAVYEETARADAAEAACAELERERASLNLRDAVLRQTDEQLAAERRAHEETRRELEKAKRNTVTSTAFRRLFRTKEAMGAALRKEVAKLRASRDHALHMEGEMRSAVYEETARADMAERQRDEARGALAKAEAAHEETRRERDEAQKQAMQWMAMANAAVDRSALPVLHGDHAWTELQRSRNRLVGKVAKAEARAQASAERARSNAFERDALRAQFAAVEGQTRGYLAEVDSRIDAGKGVWPNAGYIKDEDWARLHGEALALRFVLGALADTPEPPKPCPACNDDGVLHDMAGNAIGPCEACEPPKAAEPPDPQVDWRRIAELAADEIQDLQAERSRLREALEDARTSLHTADSDIAEMRISLGLKRPAKEIDSDGGAASLRCCQAIDRIDEALAEHPAPTKDSNAVGETGQATPNHEDQQRGSAHAGSAAPSPAAAEAKPEPRTLSLPEVMAGAERATERVAQWPAWKRELSGRTLPTSAEKKPRHRLRARGAIVKDCGRKDPRNPSPPSEPAPADPCPECGGQKPTGENDR